MKLNPWAWTTPLGGVALGLVGAFGLQGCDEATQVSEDICGPCGDIATGQVTIAANARLDGFFQAVSDLEGATAEIRADFEQDIRALAELYGLEAAQIDADFVAELAAAIEADIDANTQAGLQVIFEPPRCEASVGVAVEAQAACEAQAGCDVEVDPGMVAVQCEGTCQGECSGECSGELACAVQTPVVNCEGECEGACEIEGSAMCDGLCRGTCNGTCSATNADGECAGTCDGTCEGVCEIEGRAQCEGVCRGTCFVDPGSAQCTAEASCSGSCSGECRGSCQGEFEPPSASADCEASAECKAQAQARAEANVECSPPQLTIGFDVRGDIDADVRAAFIARMKALRVRGVGLLQGFAQVQALVTGEVGGRVVFETPPLVRLQTEIEGIIDAGVEGEFEIPPGRIACVLPALDQSLEALTSANEDVQVTLQGGAEIAAVLQAGG